MPLEKKTPLWRIYLVKQRLSISKATKHGLIYQQLGYQTLTIDMKNVLLVTVITHFIKQMELVLVILQVRLGVV